VVEQAVQPGVPADELRAVGGQLTATVTHDESAVGPATT